MFVFFFSGVRSLIFASLVVCFIFFFFANAEKFCVDWNGIINSLSVAHGTVVSIRWPAVFINSLLEITKTDTILIGTNGDCRHGCANKNHTTWWNNWFELEEENRLDHNHTKKPTEKHRHLSGPLWLAIQNGQNGNLPIHFLFVCCFQSNLYNWTVSFSGYSPKNRFMYVSKQRIVDSVTLSKWVFSMYWLRARKNFLITTV